MPMRLQWGGASLLLHRFTDSRLFQIQNPTSISRRLSSDTLQLRLRLRLFHHVSSLTLSGGPSFLPCESERRCGRGRGRGRINRFRARPQDKLVGFYCSCSSSDSVVVANDGKYGLKPVISITSRLYDYILTNVREPEILRELREETASMRGSQMQVSPEQAQLLAMLVQILGAQRCIEVGVFTGYSSLAIALVLPESGCLVACERDKTSLEIAQKYYERAGVAHKVDVRHGLAADSLKSLISSGEACSYDFAFVDAEKRMNQEYFELLLQLVRAGGVIVIDNVLWHGKVADPLVNDAKTMSIRNFNKYLMEDERVSTSMVPIGDGMTICRKR